MKNLKGLSPVFAVILMLLLCVTLSMFFFYSLTDVIEDTELEIQDRQLAANNLKITSEDLKRLKVVDKVIKEPLGGAHRNYEETFSKLKQELK